MNPLTVLLCLIVAGQAGPACRPSGGGASTDIQFMTPTEVNSPDCRWVLEVRPTEIRGDESGQVTVRPASRPEHQRRQLFQFQRDAVISWRSDGRILIVQDERGPLYSRLMLFDLERTKESASEALKIDGLIKLDVQRRIAKGHRIET